MQICTAPQMLDQKSKVWRAFFMSKYSFEFKLQVVQDYLSGKGGFQSLAKKYGIPRNSGIVDWVKGYEAFGEEALKPVSRNKNYSFEFKLRMVESYLSNDISLRELAKENGIVYPTLISHWVNIYRKNGPDALKTKRKDFLDMNQDEKKALDKKSAEYIKQLEKEVLYLKIENEYLKGLRRLRSEGTPQKKKRESSTASEDHSN